MIDNGKHRLMWALIVTNVLVVGFLLVAWYGSWRELRSNQLEAESNEDRALSALHAETVARLTKDAELEATFSLLHIVSSKEEAAIHDGKIDCRNERPDNIITVLCRDEKIVLKPYRVGNDPKNPLLIGAGHNLSANGVNERVARFILLEDVEDVRKSLRPYSWYRKASPVRQGALENLDYWLGLGNLLKLKEVLEAAERGDWRTAGNALLSSSWCINGTVARCERLRRQMVEDTWQ